MTRRHLGPMTLALALGCASVRPPAAGPAAEGPTAPSGVSVGLEFTHTSAAGRALLLAGTDARGRGCVHAVDPATGTVHPLLCVEGDRVLGLAATDDAAVVVVGSPGTGEGGGRGRLLVVPLAPAGAEARVLAEGAFDGPMAVHDGLVDAARGEGVLRAPLGGGTPEHVDERFYAGSTEVFWHRGQLYGRRDHTLVTRDEGTFRRPVAAVRWEAFADGGEQLWGVAHLDGAVVLERWSRGDPRATTVAPVAGGDAYALAVGRRAVVVASGRLLTEVRRGDGHASPPVALAGEGPVGVQAVDGAVWAVTQETSCVRGTMRGAGASRREAACDPVARARRVSSAD